ncbi:MAG: 3-hydroxyacyl-ACP dehydratase FabZ family protein [Pirellulales bacterium]|nr:3-hydroxyacyl-ACP dehydratase FabZ family protein [Pirellulales bacterium]
MRWFWFDRYLEFQSGSHAVAVKNISLAEEHLHDHFPGAPVMPNSLIIEGLAQTGGLLVAEAKRFERHVVLAKLSKAIFYHAAKPGDTLTYRANILEIREDGAMVSATSHIGDRLQAEAEIFFAYLSGKLAERVLFQPGMLLAWLQLLRVFEVGRAEDGSPLQIPANLCP